MTPHNSYVTLWLGLLVPILLALIGLIVALLTLLSLPLEAQAAIYPYFMISRNSASDAHENGAERVQPQFAEVMMAPLTSQAITDFAQRLIAVPPLFTGQSQATSQVIIFEGNVLKVSETVTAVIVENISPSPVTIRISWDECDPGGVGPSGCVSYLDNWVVPGERVQQPFSKFYSVQIWAWDTSGNLVENCNLRIVSPSLFDSPPINTPKSLAIYYAWPSYVNGAGGNITQATAVFTHFDMVVFGDGLEHPSHPDYPNTVAIISRLKENKVEVYGYIDLGVPTQNLSCIILTTYVNEWAAIGATGIFLDNAGHDFGVSRPRLRCAVDYIHSKGLNVFVNAWEPDDVLADDPPGIRTPLREGDWYLAESHPIAADQPVDLNFWWLKSFKLARYYDLTGVKIATISTGDDSNCAGLPNLPSFRATLWGTYLFGFDALGFTNPKYSASGPSADHICILPPFPMYADTRYLGLPIGPITATNIVTYNHFTNNDIIYVTCSNSTCDGGFLLAQKVFLPLVEKR